MPIIGITGGVASGKTSFRRLLLDRIDADFFDADACARELLESDANIQAQVREEVSSRAFLDSGKPNRPLLREVIYADVAKRRTMEAILHPVIRERWTRHAQKAARSHRMFLVDIPLLFETKAESLFDVVIVVACDECQQIERLVYQRGLTAELGRKMLSSQIRMSAKMRSASQVIWNGGPVELLTPQANLAAAFLKKKYE